ncbi:MAG: HEAT repeat domain-containing protein [Anaerolineales bacterium]|nr:MAG: HEAT repeat domain-containing protein [Anaerolineales bacterium]
MMNSEQVDDRVTQLIEELRRKYKPGQYETNQRIASQLKAISEPALQALAHALNDEDVTMREATVYVLGWFGKPALEALKPSSSGDSCY